MEKVVLITSSPNTVVLTQFWTSLRKVFIHLHLMFTVLELQYSEVSAMAEPVPS